MAKALSITQPTLRRHYFKDKKSKANRDTKVVPT